MIHHTVRIKVKEGVDTARLQEALESLRNQGRVIPSVQSFVVGRDFGGEFDWSGTYVIDGLDGYWEYLIHPAHKNTDLLGLPLADRIDSFDIVDDDDPEIGARIAALHQRRYERDPELAALVAGLPEYSGSSTPDAAGR